MANQNTNKTVNYWTEGTSGSLIKENPLTKVGRQIYWYNGSTDGYLAGSASKLKPRAFAVLIGF
jgi:hypothetical protein